MNHRIRAAAALAGIFLSLALAGTATAQGHQHGAPPTPQTGTAVTTTATGTFEVQLAPQETAATLGRLSIDKQFHGDLEGTSKGEMLAAQGGVPGSAGYVAIEQFTGTLNGRTGTFYLQHSGTMDRGSPSLSITVVPDTGTGDLAGITGTMNIIIEVGRHSYVFEYTLPAS
ncbi:MAG TPA: DUF3224 domain-containing protein [Longimicrobium sp.]|nr:DUF3224 domain-containing protein [Longimicrobium sp.]